MRNTRTAADGPRFHDYVLPDGRTVSLADATKGAPVTTFQVASGAIVPALRADLAARPGDEGLVELLNELGHWFCVPFVVVQCAGCRRVIRLAPSSRDLHGTSHGICTDCLPIYYPEYARLAAGGTR